MKARLARKILRQQVDVICTKIPYKHNAYWVWRWVKYGNAVSPSYNLQWQCRDHRIDNAITKARKWKR